MFGRDRDKEPVRIIPEWTENVLLLRVGDSAYALPKELVFELCDKGIVEQRFRFAKKPDEDLADIDNAKFAARVEWIFWHGLDLQQAARLLDIPRDRLARFRDHARLKYHLDRDYGQETERLCAGDVVRTMPDPMFLAQLKMGGLVKNGVGEPVTPEWKGRISLKAVDVARAFAAGVSEHELARSLNIAADDLREWVDRNKILLEALKK